MSVKKKGWGKGGWGVNGEWGVKSQNVFFFFSRSNTAVKYKQQNERSSVVGTICQQANGSKATKSMQVPQSPLDDMVIT